VASARHDRFNNPPGRGGIHRLPLTKLLIRLNDLFRVLGLAIAGLAIIVFTILVKITLPLTLKQLQATRLSSNSAQDAEIQEKYSRSRRRADEASRARRPPDGRLFANDRQLPILWGFVGRCTFWRSVHAAHECCLLLDTRSSLGPRRGIRRHNAPCQLSLSQWSAQLAWRGVRAAAWAFWLRTGLPILMLVTQLLVKDVSAREGIGTIRIPKHDEPDGNLRAHPVGWITSACRLAALY
jgi:hypothetical protein